VKTTMKSLDVLELIEPEGHVPMFRCRGGFEEHSRSSRYSRDERGTAH
jgi:hypothetical protein